MRTLLLKFRTMQVNQLRGLLYEFGATFKATLNKSKSSASL
jgi:hypothetical protein